MADEKIQLTIGGEFKASQAFAEADGAVKEMQRSFKGASSGAVRALNEISSQVDGPLKNSLSGASSLVAALGSGGLWGAAAQVAGLAISSIVKYFNDMQKAAEEVKKRLDAMVEALKATL